MSFYTGTKFLFYIELAGGLFLKGQKLLFLNYNSLYRERMTEDVNKSSFMRSETRTQN